MRSATADQGPRALFHVFIEYRLSPATRPHKGPSLRGPFVSTPLLCCLNEAPWHTLSHAQHLTLAQTHNPFTTPQTGNSPNPF